MKEYFKFKLQTFDATILVLKELQIKRDLIQPFKEEGKQFLIFLDYILVNYQDRTSISDDLRLEFEKSCIGLFDVELARKFLITPDGNYFAEMFGQLKYLYILVAGPDPDLQLYTAEELKNILSAELPDYDTGRLIRTLYEGYLDKEGRDYEDAILDYLSKEVVATSVKGEFLDVLLMALMLFFVYNRLWKMTSYQQRFVLKTYAYRAIVLGVNIREYIKKTILLPGLLSPINVVGKMSELHNDLMSNTELIPVDGDSQGGKTVSDIYNMVKMRGGEVSLGGYSFEQFLQEQYKTVVGRDVYSQWLRQLWMILNSLEDGTIVDWTKENPDTEFEKNFVELNVLVASFGYGGDFEYIVEYFKKKTGLVPWRQFKGVLANICDLENEKDLNNIIKLAEVLKTQGLFQEDLIHYDQVSEKFVWVENNL